MFWAESLCCYSPSSCSLFGPSDVASPRLSSNCKVMRIKPYRVLLTKLQHCLSCSAGHRWCRDLRPCVCICPRCGAIQACQCSVWSHLHEHRMCEPSRACSWWCDHIQYYLEGNVSRTRNCYLPLTSTVGLLDQHPLRSSGDRLCGFPVSKQSWNRDSQESHISED
jgi:hypothetical protein